MIFYSILFIACIVIDRLTKAWALKACVQECIVTPWLSCSLAFNRGVAWSFFHSDSPIIFIGVTLVVILVIAAIAWQAYQRYHTNEHLWGEVLVLAGACSNVIDRLWYGAVIDFIGFSYNTFSWPLFNAADVFIVIGVMIMMYDLLRKEMEYV